MRPAARYSRRSTLVVDGVSGSIHMISAASGKTFIIRLGQTVRYEPTP